MDIMSSSFANAKSVKHFSEWSHLQTTGVRLDPTRLKMGYSTLRLALSLVDPERNHSSHVYLANRHKWQNRFVRCELQLGLPRVYVRDVWQVTTAMQSLAV